MANYSPAFKGELKAELHRLGEQSAAARAIEDYATLRRQVLACQ